MDKLVKKIDDPHRGNLRGIHRMGGADFQELKAESSVSEVHISCQDVNFDKSLDMIWIPQILDVVVTKN